jgi:toxin FitB
MQYLLDTNVVSELRKRARCHPSVATWARGVPVRSMAISCVTVMEIEKGQLALVRRDSAQAATLRRWLHGELLATFADRVVGIDVAVALRTASLHVPDPAPDRDAWIAATALVHDLTVVTRNVTDFERTGVRLLDPWLTER